MNPDAIAILKGILAKEPRELRQDEIDFLRARWPYVGKVSRARFQDLLDGKMKKSKDENKGKSHQPEVVSDLPIEKLGDDDDTDDGDDETIEPDAPITPANPFETVDEE